LVTPGQELTYTITATNYGPSDAGNVSLSDTVPGQTTFQRFDKDGWNCPNGQNPPLHGTTVTCKVATLAAGSSRTLTLTVKVNTNASGIITNTVEVSSTVTSDPGPHLNRDSAANPTTPTADLLTTKTASSSSVTQGDELTYTIGVTNNGPTTAGTVTATDSIPSGTTWVRTGQGLWSCGAPS